MRYVAFLLAFAAGCNDLRDFAGPWHGTRVGSDPALAVGISQSASAELEIQDIDAHGLRAHLSVDNGGAPLITGVEIVSVPGAEADALSTMTFGGSPLRVYLAFAPVDDSAGDALAMIGLYDSHRIDLRLLRGGAAPIYAIFSMSQHE